MITGTAVVVEVVVAPAVVVVVGGAAVVVVVVVVDVVLVVVEHFGTAVVVVVVAPAVVVVDVVVPHAELAALQRVTIVPIGTAALKLASYALSVPMSDGIAAAHPAGYVGTTCTHE